MYRHGNEQKIIMKCKGVDSGRHSTTTTHTTHKKNTAKLKNSKWMRENFIYFILLSCWQKLFGAKVESIWNITKKKEEEKLTLKIERKLH